MFVALVYHLSLLSFGSRTFEFPLFIEVTSLKDLLLERSRRIIRLAASDLENGPITQSRKQEVVKSVKLRFVKGVAAVEHKIAPWRSLSRKRAGTDQCKSMISRRVTRGPDLLFV